MCMKLYWEMMSPKTVQKDLPEISFNYWDIYFTDDLHREEKSKADVNLSADESSEIDRKISSYEEIYSKLDEVYPRLWIGDFSSLKTSRKIQNIKYRIILDDCEKCITNRHDGCSLLRPRPYIYRPPCYTTEKNLHCMGIEAVDDTTFPIYEHFRAACDYIEKSLSSSTKANVAVVSRRGRGDYAKRAIRPNLGFMIQLIQLDRKLHHERRRSDNRRMKNVFPIRRKILFDNYWIRDEPAKPKSTKSFTYLDDRMANPDRRLGVNTNLLHHSPFSAPGPHFCKDVENSIMETHFKEMLPFYKLDIASTRCEYKYPIEGRRILASFSC
ncbi:dual specificity phosphatase DUPD1 [Caerostris extrusa]|uniref:Dual specificity phosphatase DUPD1 n=1 Tax=Caerostris extrusa TaxID=172846 RepID=A0AAV4SRW1_CAEEX|nr:dual specificity phosphatase DUPD1 [Caerostris extrusa]